MILKIDSDFLNLIPPLTEDEFNQLEQNILSANRCRDAILVWKGFIIDGHHRYVICHKHSIPFEISRVHFASKEDALIWIAENQLGRRNLVDALRIELSRHIVEMLHKKADGPINTRKMIAETAGVGDRTVYKYMKIVGEGDPELIEQVRKGEMKIGTAYKKLQAVTKVVREIYDDKNMRYKNSLFSYDNVLMNIDRIGKLYQFTEQALSLAGDHGMKRLGSVRKRLEAQLQVVVGLMR